VPIGVYPMRLCSDRWGVKWGCSDLDVDDLQAAINLRNALRALDITSWIEVSKSKGYHVWVFAERWGLAATMRRALLAAHDIAGVPATEVNPKQERLEPGQYGNYVRLPYPGGLKETPERRVVLADTEAANKFGGHSRYSLPTFVEVAERGRTSWEVLNAASALYVPPPEPIAVTIDPEASAAVDRLERRLNGLAYTIFMDGPLEDGDRSGTLFKLAVNAFESGLDPNEVYAVVEDADARWGKFSERRDGAQQLERIVARAASA